LADEQTTGRGQGSNSWNSEPGKNLLFSIIYNTSFLPASRQFELNMALSIGLAMGLSSIAPSIEWKIKWPNDILGNEKKVCGVLIENMIRGQMLQHSIIGIGINVNQVDFPVELVNASSLSQISGEAYNLDEVLALTLKSIESQFLQLKAGVDMKRKYLENLYRLNVEADYSDEDGSFTAIISDVEPDGRLTVIRSGQPAHYNFQQLKFL
jgi:BirA family transcriptional regulator, biotin operon repressor / biotin---[acetyl-CoA-carboxylase] ligase